MLSTVALQAKEKGRERNNLVGPKFEDTSMYFLRWSQLAPSTMSVTGFNYINEKDL